MTVIQPSGTIKLSSRLILFSLLVQTSFHLCGICDSEIGSNGNGTTLFICACSYCIYVK